MTDHAEILRGLYDETLVGNKPADRISGLWPSDHAGTVATLRLKG